MVVDALSCKESRVSYHLKSMTFVVTSGIFEQLRGAQFEGVKENNV